MIFIVQPPNGTFSVAPEPPVTFPVVLLSYSNWDDYGYRTSSEAQVILQPDAQPIGLGALRIMRRGQPSHWQTNSDPEWVFQNGPFQFVSLNDIGGDYCSLAIDLNFYNALHSLGTDIAQAVLTGLRDADLPLRFSAMWN